MKKKTIENLTIGCFAAFIGIFGIWNAWAPKAEVSYNENRTLAKAPELSVSHIFSGKFDDDFETWFSDHFVHRDAWIELKSGVKRAALAIENNNVYYAGEHRLIGTFQDVNQKNLESNIEQVSTFAKNHDIKVNILLVPTAAWGAETDLPGGAWNVDQEALLDQVSQKFPDQNFINFTKHTDPSPSMYFHTDHHWNESGAYMGYAAICRNVLNKDPNRFTYTLASNSFEGTMYSRSGAFWTKPDSIYTITPESGEQNVTVNYDNEHTENSLYSKDRLNEKDKYTYYVDGNHAYVDIRTDVTNGRKALLIKDSYSHILIPFLATEYSEIELVDLRYYHSPVSDLLKDDQDVYVLYSLDNFCSDMNLAFLR